MELMLDTANAKEIRELNELVAVSGVTTNPAIIVKSDQAFEVVVDKILSILSADQKFFAQVVAHDTEGILEEARRICGLRERNTYAKIPVTHEGLRAIRKAKAEGLGVLATAIYSADQAFVAALNGADYLAPYVNRMCNYGDGVSQVVELVHTIKKHQLDAKIVAASFKNASQAHALIAAGVPALTLPPDVVRSLIDHPATETAVQEFEQGWEHTYSRTTLLS